MPHDSSRQPSLALIHQVRVQVFLKEILHAVGQFEVDCLSVVIDSRISAHPVHVCGKDVECDIVGLAIQPLLDEAQVHWVLHSQRQDILPQMQRNAAHPQPLLRDPAYQEGPEIVFLAEGAYQLAEIV